MTQQIQRDKHPERQLWCAVISQAIADLRGFASGSHEHPRLVREAAYKWLFEPNRDFAQVCDMAGMNADAIRYRLKMMVANGDEKIIEALKYGIRR